MIANGTAVRAFFASSDICTGVSKPPGRVREIKAFIKGNNGYLLSKEGAKKLMKKANPSGYPETTGGINPLET